MISSKIFKSEVAKETMQKRFRLPKSKMINIRREYTDTIYFEYYNKLNTISDINRGISWEGLQNRNLVAKETYKNGIVEDTENLRYEFDSKGRVTKQYYVEYEGDYTLFTYEDIKITN